MSAAAASKRPMLNMDIDPQLRAAMDAYIADFNAKNEGKVNIRCTTESALKKFLEPKGFWPFPPPAARRK